MDGKNNKSALSPNQGITNISGWTRTDIQTLVAELEQRKKALHVQNKTLKQALSAMQSVCQAAQDRYRVLFECAPVGYLVLDSEGCIQEANQAAIALLGTNKAIVGQFLSAFVASSSQGALDTHCALATTNDATPVELTLETKGVVPRTVRIESALEPSTDDANHRLRCVLVDITERKKREDKLRIAERVYEGTGEAIVVTSPDGCIQTINQAFTRITGYTESEALDSVIGNLLKPKLSSKAFYQGIWANLNLHGVWRGEVSNRRKNGEVFASWVTAYRLNDDKEQLRYFVIIFSDISQLKDSQRKNTHLITHDGLTGLPNRRLFKDRLQQAIIHAQYDTRSVALLLLGLDYFQNINETYGHEVGDELLVQVATKLKKLVRKVDTISRVGGDEFTIILPDSTLDEVGFIAKRLVDELTGTYDILGKKRHITVSAGLAVYPHDGVTADILHQAVSIATYRAKKDGRNRLQLYEAALHHRLLEEHALEEGLHRALTNNELRLVYQPQFDARHPERLVGAEVLLRWQDPEKGAISPGKFIPIAEKSSLITMLGYRVLTDLCKQLKTWQAAGLSPPPISFNVSPQDFREAQFAAGLLRTITRYGINAEQLKVELTESALTEYSGVVQEEIRTLHSYGIALSIDDFGTGYSSLGNLKRLPLTELKIDKSFVDGLGENDHDKAIAGASLAMAKALGLRTVAEGVETQQQLSWLQANGCDRIQGYLLARPLEADDFQTMLSNLASH